MTLTYTDLDAERFHAWVFGHAGTDQSKCPGCRRPHMRNLHDDDDPDGMHVVHAEGCPYLAWCEEHVETIELVNAECSCDPMSLHSAGSVASIRAGETDPFCPEHGVEDIRSGAYQAMNRAEQRSFRLRLFSQLVTMDD